MRSTERGCAGEIREVGSHRVFAFLSAGVDTKANTLELVRVPSSLLQRLQRGVALESLCDRGCSFGTEPVVFKTAEEGFGGGVVSRVNGR